MVAITTLNPLRLSSAMFLVSKYGAFICTSFFYLRFIFCTIVLFIVPLPQIMKSKCNNVLAVLHALEMFK